MPDGTAATMNPEALATGDRVLLVAVAAGAVAQIALHVFEPPLAMTWSYAHLNRYPGAGLVALLLAAGLPLATARGARHPWAEAPPPQLSPSTGIGLALLLGLLFLGIGWFFPVRAVSIDAQAFAVEVWKGVVRTWRWYLTILSFSAGHRAAETMAGTPIPARDFVSGLNALLSGASFSLLLASACRLTRTRLETLLLVALSWTALGNLQLALYYMDIYPLVQFAFALFLWAALRVVDADGHPVWPALVAAVGPFFYVGLVLLLPAMLVVAAATLRRPDAARRLAVVAAAVVVATGLATIPGYGTPFAFPAYLADLGRDGTRTLGLSADSNLLPAAYLFSLRHLAEYLHSLLLVDGVGVLLCATTAVPMLGRVLRGDVASRAALLFALTAPVLFYSFVMDPLWGPYWDWDLFSYAAVPTSMLGGYSLVVWGRRQPTARALLAGLLAAAALIHLGARLNAIELDNERHTRESPPHVEMRAPTDHADDKTTGVR